ncbi:MAG TPA: UDP-N-acetylmuramoyl-tripeptide--D-alanyl-D-alanine ligase [Candidatus Paceibacterota bacterium]|nr:UDP-N-acetylmuramoyl-tripeptide--D-alanyl-D-alanine ligase [Candidatus Paceibacterota bacterium]
MKRLARNIVATILAILARAVLRKYRPGVVMVTGSVGKTSTKDAVAAVVRDHFFSRASEKSYNSEFGVPLTIIGSKNPWSNPIRWLKVFQDALALIMLPSHYPKLLVLEVGADSPGDLERILRIATPDVVVVTKLPELPVHVEFYASPNAVREEEFEPAYALNAGSPLIISADDPYAREMAKPLPVRTITYGFDEDAEIHIADPKVRIEDGEPVGMEARLLYQGSSYPLIVRGALGRQQLYAPAAALAVALSLSMPLEEALKAIEGYEPPPGRSRILPGKNGSILIDDSYNSSPAAVEEALGAMSLVPGKRRIAVLGDMLELGRYSKREHERIGELAAAAADVVVAVGGRAHVIAEAAEREGRSEVFAYETSKEAATLLPEIVGEGDIVLIKGSQSIRTERIVEVLLRDMGDRTKLVRQDREWKSR